MTIQNNQGWAEVERKAIKHTTCEEWKRIALKLWVKPLGVSALALLTLEEYDKLEALRRQNLQTHP